MKLRLFAAAGLVSCAALAAGAAVVHKADESAIRGEVVALEAGKVVVASRAADGTEQRVAIPLEDVVEINFDPNAAVPATDTTAIAQSAPPTAAQRGHRNGVSAHFYNAPFWKSPRPAGGAIGAGRSPRDVPPEAALTGQDILVVAGAPDVSKTLPNLNNHFGEEPPAEGINKDVVSAAFSGRIRPKFSGEYTFLCRSDDDHWLLVDGKLVCSDPGAHGARDPREGSRPDTVVPIKLEAGKDYDFVFLVNEGLVDFVAIAQWLPPGETEPQDIPDDCLFAESGPPAAPTDLKVSATTDTGVTLSFRDVATSEIRYQVERATEPEFVNAAAAGVAPINAATFVDKDLTPGVTYHYRIRAVNFEGTSPPVVVAATPGVPPGQQAIAAARPPGAARVARPAAAEPPPVPRGDKKGVTAQFFNDQYWRSPNPVVARPGDGGAAVPADGVPAPAPAPVVITAAPDAATTFPTLDNNFAEAAPHPGINENDVSVAFTGRIRPKETGEYTFVCTTDDDHWLYVDGKLVCSDPGGHSARDAREGAAPETIVPIRLEAGRDYDFIFLVNEGTRDFTCHAQWIPPGRGELEEIPEDCLLAQTGAPAAPTDLRVTETTDTGVTLSFRDASTSEVRFSVERDLTPEFLNPAPAGSVPINGGKFVDAELRTGVTYYYRVRAVNFDGRSAPAIVAATPGVPVAQQQAVAAANKPSTTPGAAQPVVGAQPVAAAQPGASAAPAQAAQAAAAMKLDAEGFITLFNGKDLTGWDGDKTRWTAEDGAITATTTDETRGGSGVSTWLIWTGGEVRDFELRLKYKAVGVNSGINYRSVVVPNRDRWQVQGYQFDIEDVGRPEISGSLWDEPQGTGRGTLANVGEKVRLTAAGEREVESAGTTPQELVAALNVGDWNEVVITAVGNTLTHTLNGIKTAEVVDEAEQGEKSGVLALQFDRWLVGTIQYKDIRLKPLGGTGIAKANPPPAMPPTAAPGPTVPAPAVPAAARVPAAAQDVAAAPSSAPAVPAAAGAAGSALGLWTLQLNGGDRLTGGVTRWDEKELVVRSEAGEVTVPTRRLREAWRLGGPEAGGAKAASAMVAPGTAEDTALVRADNNEIRAVRGVVLGADADSLAFRFIDRDRKIALDRLVGVVLGETDDAKADPFGGKFHQSVRFASGDSLSGVWVGMAAGMLELRTPWDVKVIVPAAGVARIKCRNGALVYLSDLVPAKVEQVPYFDRILPYRLDASLTGGRLKLSDGEYDKGIAVHSRTVLHYDVGGTYGRFKGKVGFQEPEGNAGNAAVRILGDGKVLFERPEASGAKPPEEFDVDASGVKTLTLEVDFGKGQDVGDRVVWANPRLIRTREK